VIGAGCGDNSHAVFERSQLDNVAVGVAASPDDRTFYTFSRAIDETEPLSLGEHAGGDAVVPYPPGWTQDATGATPTNLLSVQAVTVDAQDRLWILDTAKVGQAPIVPGTPKLVAVDLATDETVQTIYFPPEVAGPTAMLNDVRIDLSKGAAGVAFLTDSSSQGPNALVVVDLASGTSMRRLNDHPTVKPEPITVMCEGDPLIVAEGPMAGEPYRVGADGIALDADHHHLYYRALTAHHLYRVNTDALADPAVSDAEVAATIEDLGDLGFASDGLLSDSTGRLYLTDYEHNQVRRRDPDGTIETVAAGDDLLWPDTLALRLDGTLVITATQIERGKHLRGTDQRMRPFTVWQTPTDSRPLLLGR
jgi:sugar lactone lactonase YvrE